MSGGYKYWKMPDDKRPRWRVSAGLVEFNIDALCYVAPRWRLDNVTRFMDCGRPDRAGVVECDENGDLITEPSYDEFVAALTSRPVVNLDSQQVDMLHGVIGLVTESGELLDQLKKHIYYGRPLDRVNMIEEIGDLEFYLSMLRQALHVSREEVLSTNMAKLMSRYPGGKFDAERAINRDLAKERQTLEGGGK